MSDVNRSLFYETVEKSVNEHYQGVASYEQLLGMVAGDIVRSPFNRTSLFDLDSTVKHVLRESNYRWGE